MAYFEATGWQAYYDRRWGRLLRLIIQLGQEQFRIPCPRSWQAAYYVTRASLAWVPLDHDARRVQAYYEKFYRLAGRYSHLRFDPAQVAALELRYNDDHRRLSGQSDKSAFLATMVELHSAVFNISPAQAHESAELRVQANTTVDRITSGASTDVAGDWRRIRRDLRACYHSIARATEENRATSG